MRSLRIIAIGASSVGWAILFAFAAGWWRAHLGGGPPPAALTGIGNPDLVDQVGLGHQMFGDSLYMLLPLAGALFLVGRLLASAARPWRP